MSDWQRIPVPIESESDRRELAAILTACGLEIRIVRERPTKSGVYKRYIEYRPQA
nr:hypothetical protein [uncultured Dysosmobacter sp.]